MRNAPSQNSGREGSNTENEAKPDSSTQKTKEIRECNHWQLEEEMEMYIAIIEFSLRHPMYILSWG